MWPRSHYSSSPFPSATTKRRPHDTPTKQTSNRVGVPGLGVVTAVSRNGKQSYRRENMPYDLFEKTLLPH